MFKVVHRKTFALPTESDIVRPDLSFSIKEIQQKFTLQHLILNNRNVQDNYLLSPNSDDFDSPSVETPQNYDLADAFSDTHRVYNARKSFVDGIRNNKKNVDTPVKVSEPQVDKTLKNE